MTVYYYAETKECLEFDGARMFESESPNLPEKHEFVAEEAVQDYWNKHDDRREDMIDDFLEIRLWDATGNHLGDFAIATQIMPYFDANRIETVKEEDTEQEAD